MMTACLGAVQQHSRDRLHLPHPHPIAVQEMVLAIWLLSKASADRLSAPRHRLCLNDSQQERLNRESARQPNVGAGAAQILYQQEVDVPERVPAKLTGRERT